MTSDQKCFIETIGEAAVSFYETYQILPSLTIAQAIMESNWGKSGLSKVCNNFFGMKWTSGCGCAYQKYTTKEQRKDGTYYTVIAKFRKYESIKEGIRGYYEFLQYKRYQNLRGVIDYKRACELIRIDGFATSLSYTKNLIHLIETYDLALWDRKALVGKSKESKDKIKDSQKAIAEIKMLPFIKGNYTVTASAICVRRGAGLMQQQKRFFEMTENAKLQNALYQKSGLAFYGKGTKFRAIEIIKVSEKEYWAKTKSGFVALMYEGEVFVKKG